MKKERPIEELKEENSKPEPAPPPVIGDWINACGQCGAERAHLRPFPPNNPGVGIVVCLSCSTTHTWSK
jgi:hypothetical protein